MLIPRRSGILVLINDVDWEVMDKEKTELSVSCLSSSLFFNRSPIYIIFLISFFFCSHIDYC